MPTYDIIDEYNLGKDPDCIGVNSYWLIAIIRYKYPLTANRKNMLKLQPGDPGSSVSFDNGGKSLSSTRPMLLIDSDCVSLTVSTTKGSHLGQLQAVLTNSGINYLSEILPGDWVFAWIVNDEEKYLDLKERVSQLKPANKFDDGLKFIGRVQDMGKTLMQSPSGPRTVQYNLQATSFKELDSQIFYDPHLMMKIPSIGQYLMRMSINLNSIFKAASAAAGKGTGGITSDLAIPILLKVLIGDGIPPSAANPGRGNVPTAAGLTSGDEAPFAYVVPDAVGKLLGIKVKSKKTGMCSYADVLELLIGLQKYSGGIFPSYFHPDNTDMQVSGDGNRHKTAYPLKGTFLPAPISFHGKSVWTILGEFLNPAVNEMYATLRLTPRGVVAPMLVVRQLPFSTPVMTDALKTEVTSFMEVPRWRAAPHLVRSMDVGRSDSMHFNFVHVYGQPNVSGGLGITEQMVRNPPFRDEEDIKKYGLGPYLQTVNCSMADTIGGPRKWMMILSDFLMGQHFMLNGSCSLQGIVSPVCCGDNFEFDDTVFHIESVQHNASISDGRKSFTTRLSLSHGIRSDLPTAVSSIPPPVMDEAFTIDGIPGQLVESLGADAQNPDFYLYSGVDSADNTGYAPGNTVDDSLNETEPKKGSG